MTQDKEPTITTTFNMKTRLKSKAKIYIAYYNQTAEENNAKNGNTLAPKLDLGKLLNDALENYLQEVEVE